MKGLSKIWHIHSTEYYVVNKNVCSNYALTWKIVYDIIFSEKQDFKLCAQL